MTDWNVTIAYAWFLVLMVFLIVAFGIVLCAKVYVDRKKEAKYLAEIRRKNADDIARAKAVIEETAAKVVT